MYDAVLVQKMLEEYITQDRNAQTQMENGDEIEEIGTPGILSEASKLMVAKLIDGYLAEIAKDPNLPLSMFVGIVEMVSSFPRPNPSSGELIGLFSCRSIQGSTRARRREYAADGLQEALSRRLHARCTKRETSSTCRCSVLFFEQARAATSSGCSTPDLAKAVKDLNCGSYRSSRSATANADEDWDAIASAEELRTLRGELAALRLGNGDRSSAENRMSNADKTAVGKMKGLIMSKKMLSKIWSNKVGQAENSGSDSSDSLGSTNHDDVKCTPPRKGRHSVS
ncbi:UNVERIFIED_CONTAM: BTB/POZ domain-containing protein NPY2 [Sesamum radiatum]|uniref:BTB/POZ domain-containing protein NPY2 n=1 Tax=Sesamum radiatum TaxID=300843 RepID=A0AAW2S3U7_SESRA